MTSWHHRTISALGLQPVAYRLAEVFHGLRFRFANSGKREEPIIIYQMGKVGSSSLAATIKELVPATTVYHVHRLTGEGLNDIEQRATSRGRVMPGPDYWTARYLGRALANYPHASWNLISLTRDPVARNLSGFFQSLSLWSSNALERFRAGERRTVFEELLLIFLRDYPHHKPHVWFDNELKEVFGVDVYSMRFDQSSGYSIYRRRGVNLMVIRLEDLSSCYRQALAAFLNRDTSHLPLVPANISDQKRYNLLYDKFLEWLVLPDDYLEDQYSTHYAQHFYSEAELMSFRRKWSKV